MDNSKKFFKNFLLQGVSPAIIISDPNFQEKLLLEYENLNDRSSNSDGLFLFPIINHIHPIEYRDFLLSYELILDLLERKDSTKFKKIHKGSPFYFIAMGALMAGDFEKGVFFMDAALTEDIKNGYGIDQPAGLFFKLDTNNENHAALPFVQSIRSSIENQLNQIMSGSNTNVLFDELVSKFSQSATSKPELRTIFTSFITFAYEYDTRYRHLELTDENNGTSEPIFTHLIKGCIIFESLLSKSNPGKDIKGTLKDYLKNKDIYTGLELSSQPTDMGKIKTYQELIKEIKKFSLSDILNEDAIRITWKTRNLLSHSIGWPEKPKANEFELMHFMILKAIYLAMKGLY